MLKQAFQMRNGEEAYEFFLEFIFDATEVADDFELGNFKAKFSSFKGSSHETDQSSIITHIFTVDLF